MWCCGRTPRSARIIRRFEVSYLSRLRGTSTREARRVGEISPLAPAYAEAPPPQPSPASGRGSAAVQAATYTAGTGNAVTDLIFSIAKREVTFFSGTAPINFL
ncbi:MAG: hypothetical protein JWR80_363 [Bradyrhizobium sp.]|nr:hypothetical protein [Bradyrhizobium sp.]